MKTVAMVAVFCLVLLLGSGCSPFASQNCCASTGWEFKVGRPSTLTVASPTILAPQTGPIGVQSLGALAGPSPSIIHAPAQPMPVGPESKAAPFVVPGVRVADCEPCDCRAILKRLDRIADAVGAKQE